MLQIWSSNGRKEDEAFSRSCDIAIDFDGTQVPNYVT